MTGFERSTLKILIDAAARVRAVSWDDQERRRLAEDGICAQCGGDFKPMGSGQVVRRFCSNICRKRSHYGSDVERKRQKARQRGRVRVVV